MNRGFSLSGLPTTPPFFEDELGHNAPDPGGAGSAERRANALRRLRIHPEVGHPGAVPFREDHDRLGRPPLIVLEH
jgi:hypothetical protein